MTVAKALGGGLPIGALTPAPGSPTSSRPATTAPRSPAAPSSPRPPTRRSTCSTTRRCWPGCASWASACRSACSSSPASSPSAAAGSWSPPRSTAPRPTSSAPRCSSSASWSTRRDRRPSASCPRWSSRRRSSTRAWTALRDAARLKPEGQMDRPLDLTAPAVDGEPADRMRVLLVEDDDGDALIVEEQLELSGARVDVERTPHAGRGRRRGPPRSTACCSTSTSRTRRASRACTGCAARAGARHARAHGPRRRAARHRGARRGRPGLPDQGLDGGVLPRPLAPLRRRAPPGRADAAAALHRAARGARERPPRARPAAQAARQRPGAHARVALQARPPPGAAGRRLLRRGADARRARPRDRRRRQRPRARRGRARRLAADRLAHARARRRAARGAARHLQHVLEVERHARQVFVDALHASRSTPGRERAILRLAGHPLPLLLTAGGAEALHRPARPAAGRRRARGVAGRRGGAAAASGRCCSSPTASPTAAPATATGGWGRRASPRSWPRRAAAATIRRSSCASWSTAPRTSTPARWATTPPCCSSPAAPRDARPLVRARRRRVVLVALIGLVSAFVALQRQGDRRDLLVDRVDPGRGARGRHRDRAARPGDQRARLPARGRRALPRAYRAGRRAETRALAELRRLQSRDDLAGLRDEQAEIERRADVWRRGYAGPAIAAGGRRDRRPTRAGREPFDAGARASTAEQGALARSARGRPRLQDGGAPGAPADLRRRDLSCSSRPRRRLRAAARRRVPIGRLAHDVREVARGDFDRELARPGPRRSRSWARTSTRCARASWPRWRRCATRSAR